MTGCGCLAVIAALIGLIIIFVRGSFDAGEPIEQAALLALVLLSEWWRREAAPQQLVRARGA